MAKKFIYLNTSNPETFIQVKNNDIITLNVSNDAFKDYYINSVYVGYFKDVKDENGNNTKTTLDLNVSNTEDSHIRLYVNPKTTEDVKFSFNIGETEYTVKYSAIMVSENNKYENTNTINNDRSSFMLLRTNPKLTGNIKLVVDSDNNMYLDTFKVSSNLSDKRYRHVLVSGKSFYSNDVKNVFSELPKTDLYKIPEDGYDLFKIKKNLYEQYNDTYSYGVKTNNDKLYSENFALLAPLYLNEVLPDFFLIFRVNGAYSDDMNLSATERMKNFLKNGKLIKSFDMRKNTPIGNYLINMQSEFQRYPSSVYVSCDDYNYNNWIGISVDNGIISQINETTYRLSKLNNQVELDNYITNGFERNGLLNSRIINFEFMFNDNDDNIKDFSVNRYYGIYVKNNKYKKIFVVNSVNNNENSLISSEILDSNYETISDINNSVSSLDEMLNSERIFNITTDVETSNKCTRFNSNPLVILDEMYKNIPYKNILTTPVVEEIIKDSESDLNTQFITITINEPLAPGEHLRIIDNNVYDNSDNQLLDYQHSSEVFEVVAGKVDEYYKNVDEYFNVENDEIINYVDLYDTNILNEISMKYLSVLDENGNIIGKDESKCNKESIKIHRNIFAGYSSVDNHFNTNNKNEIIKKQIEQIVAAFNSLTDKTFSISNYDDKNISFVANDAVNFLRFERISSEVVHKNENTNTLNDNDFRTEDINKVTYFNNFKIPGTIISMYNKVGIEDAALLPSSFEVWSNRLAYIVNFAKTDTGIEMNSGRINSGYIYNIPIETYQTIDKISLIKNVQDEYIRINNFDIQYYTFDDVNDNGIISVNKFKDDLTNVVKSYKSSNMYIITTDMQAYIHNNELNIYSIAPVHLNIAGLMPIKDFNFNVLDKVNSVGSDSLNSKINGTDEYDNGYSDSNYIYFNIKPNETITLSADKKYKILSGTAKDINTDYEYTTTSDLPISNYVLKNIKSTILKIGMDIDLNVEEFASESVRNNNSEESLLNYFNLNETDTETLVAGNINNVNKNIYNNKPYADLSLVIPTTTKWRVNGLDTFNNKIKLGFNYNNCLRNKSYNLLESNTNLFGYPVYKSLSSDNNSNYIFNDIMDITMCKDGVARTFKDKILYHNGKIDELLYTQGNNKSKYSKMYYNHDLNSLETIISGKKIRISSNNDTFDIKKYNNYLFTFICSPSNNDSNKLIDIIIDETSNIFMCVWYLGIANLSYTYRNNIMYDNIYNCDIINGNEVITKDDTNTKFSIYKNIINLSNPINNVFPCYNILDTENINGNIFINTMNINKSTFINDYTYEIINPNILKDRITSDKVYKTTFEYKDVIDGNNDVSLNIQSNIVNSNENKLFAYVLGTETNTYFDISKINNILNDDFTNIYIKTVNGSQRYSNNLMKFEFVDYINLLNTAINKDINVYPGYCDPEFIDIFEFENNETEDIIEYTNKNFISSNTRISNVKNIGQIWINKVSDQIDYVLEGETDNSKLIPMMTIDVIHNHDITKSSWDDNFYKKYTRKNNKETVKYINGSNADISNKNFFGSPAIKLSKDVISLTRWNYYTVESVLKHFNQSADNVDKFEIKINITDELTNIILNNKDFISNWKFNDDTVKYAHNYIKNVLKNNYIINNKNIVNIYKRTLGVPLTNEHDILSEYVTNNGFEKVTNIHSKIFTENDKIYLLLEVPNALNCQYAIEYMINR